MTSDKVFRISKPAAWSEAILRKRMSKLSRQMEHTGPGRNRTSRQEYDLILDHLTRNYATA